MENWVDGKNVVEKGTYKMQRWRLPWEDYEAHSEGKDSISREYLKDQPHIALFSAATY